MKALRTIVGLIVLACVAAGGWIVMFHSDWFKPHLSEEGEKEVVTDVPVRAAVVTRATLRHYVEGYGAIEPEPAMGGKPAAGAVISSPVAGLVAQVLCETGQKVASGAVLFQLDERLAKAQEEQWAAALESAKATLARVKATPRPEQVEVAQLLVEKARVAAELARANFERMQKLRRKTCRLPRRN